MAMIAGLLLNSRNNQPAANATQATALRPLRGSRASRAISAAAGGELATT